MKSTSMDAEGDMDYDVENKLLPSSTIDEKATNAVKPSEEGASSSTQAFWLLVWMAK
jgi:hypothetical protein